MENHMSDTQTNAQTTSKPTTNAPRKVKPNAPRIDHSAAIAQYAKAKGIDTTRAGKLFRARLRANFDTIAKCDAKHYGKNGTFKREANDKRPWGTHSRSVLKDLGLIK
jgi:hypothetical protein